MRKRLAAGSTGRYIYRPMLRPSHAFLHSVFPRLAASTRPARAPRRDPRPRPAPGHSRPRSKSAWPAASPPPCSPRRAHAHSRERIFTLQRTVWCWLWQILQGHTSCREVVRQVQALFALHGGRAGGGLARPPTARRAASCPRRCWPTLFAASAASASNGRPRHRSSRFWAGAPVRVVDGSGARLCRHAGQSRRLPAQFQPATRAPVFPTCASSSLFCLASGALLAQATGSLADQRTAPLARPAPALRPGDILLGDRAYGHYVVAALLQRPRVDLICDRARPVPRSGLSQGQTALGQRRRPLCLAQAVPTLHLLDAPSGRALPAGTHRASACASPARAGAFAPTRFVLVTTLLDPPLYPAAEILATHARRWRLEMSLDDLKTTLGMARCAAKRRPWCRRNCSSF